MGVVQTDRAVEIIVEEVLEQVDAELRGYKDLAEEMFGRLAHLIAAKEGVGVAIEGFSPRHSSRCDACGQVIRAPK